MGISADIILFKSNKTQEYFQYDWLTPKNKRRLEELYDDAEMFYWYEELFYIGDGETFKKGILDKYHENEGLIPLKEAMKYIKEKERIEKFLKDFFKTDMEYILEDKRLYVNLNY